MSVSTIERQAADKLVALLSVQDSKKGIVWERVFSPGEDPYATIELEQADILIKNYSTGDVVLQQDGIWYPVAWSQNARNIFAQHYLRGRLGTSERETSVVQSINRVIDTIVGWAMHGRIVEESGKLIFIDKLFADEQSAINWAVDMKYAIITQKINFNSPVWYNIGVPNVPQQCSACFILQVDDNKQSIRQWYVDENEIFAGGSGSGLDLSNIRSSYEELSHGGKASGPTSFMTAADSNAGTMSSGGRSRRAACMRTLNISHPDIFELASTYPDGKPAPGFIQIKVKAESVMRVLRDNGFDVDVSSGRDGFHVQYQNANNSVRVTNDFMEAVLVDGEWRLKAIRPDLVWKELPIYQARMLWKEIAKAAHDCADPGLQFDTTINHWHTTPAAGRINSSNPCSEYLHLNNSPCNLAATNLMQFLNLDGSWDTEHFVAAVMMLTIAQTVLAAHGDYPTERIAEVARGFRQIGQGYTNLGAALMALGYPYDSENGRAWAASITSLMQATIYRTSSQIAQVWGTYSGVISEVAERNLPGFDHPENRRAHLGVASLHQHYHRAIANVPSQAARKRAIRFGDESHIDIYHNEIVGKGVPVRNNSKLKHLYDAATRMWVQAVDAGRQYGYANAHMSVLAPMGTNGYMMDNDTTGIEPDMGLRKNKKKVSGDHMLIVNQTILRAVVSLGYTLEEAQEVVVYAESTSSVVGAPHLRKEHYAIFDTALEEPVEHRFIQVGGHLSMMGAVQPFLSGAISKTANCPEETTIEEVEKIHFDAWRLGTKSVAIYRNNSKQTQPVSSGGAAAVVLAGPPPTVRVKLPQLVDTKRIKLAIGEFELYAHVGLYANGQPGEIFFVAGQEGSTLNGLLAGQAKQVSLSLQHGTPIQDVITLWLHMNFEPKGMLTPRDSKFASCSSILDLLARELALLLLTKEQRQAMGIMTRGESIDAINDASPGQEHSELATVVQSTVPVVKSAVTAAGKICGTCGSIMRRTGTCDVCLNCGNTSGCS